MERRAMNWLNFIGFFIVGFVILFAILFLIVCAFDRFMESQFKLDERDEWYSEEIERNAP